MPAKNPVQAAKKARIVTRIKTNLYFIPIIFILFVKITAMFIDKYRVLR
jgi:hypothetical protein